MRSRLRGLLAVIFAAGSVSVAALQAPSPSGAVVRAEGCARGRASGGVYTGTNPECARECVALGKKIVLIDPVAKTILNIGNQDAGKKNISDYVEATEVLNPQTKTFQINSLKMLAAGKATCELPKPAR
jgi:hypothetical protein